jgi:hypothetical protein
VQTFPPNVGCRSDRPKIKKDILVKAMNNFEEFLRQGEPNKAEKAKVMQIKGLKNSCMFEPTSGFRIVYCYLPWVYTHGYSHCILSGFSTQNHEGGLI